MATITLNIPDDIAAAIGETSETQTRFALEALAVESVRCGRLYKPQAAALTGMTRLDFLVLLQARRVPDDTTVEALKEGYQAIDRIFPK